MPPRAKAGRGLAALTGAESDFDDDLDGASRATTSEPAKRPRGRPPGAAKATKPAATKPAVAPAPRGRPPKTAPKPQPSPRKTSAAKDQLGTAARSTKRDRSDEDDEMKDALEEEVEEEPSPAKIARTGRGRPAKKPPARQAVVPDEEEEQEAEEKQEDSDVELERHEQPPFEVDDGEMTGSAVRRKLGEMTKKYESLAARHRELRNTAVTEADRNFERLRKQADENAAASTELIEELKAELQAQKALVKEGAEVRRQLEQRESECASWESKVSTLNDSLAEAGKEIKTLSTKLSAFRSAEAGIKVPGSALKPGAAGNRSAPSDAVQTGQAKEDLYGDLTGLILRGVRLGEEEDVFDCIQTGRNGTLHFKLALDKMDPSENYEDVQFTYRPQLDEKRDADLLDILPDFLTEEIAFPRTHAGKFYARVIKALTS